MHLGVLLVVLYLWSLTSAFSNNGNSQIQSGKAEMDIVMTAFNVLRGISPVDGDLFPELNHLAGTIVATNGLLSLLFQSKPVEESPEVKLMEHEFGEIKKKFDTKSKENFDLTEHLIADAKLKAAYITDEKAILSAFQQLKTFVNELQNLTCSDANDCLRQRRRMGQHYVPKFDISRNMNSLYRTVTDNNTTLFPEPLLEHINRTYKCDVPKIRKFANGILRLAFKEQQVTIAHNILSGSTYSITNSVNDWMNRMYELQAHSKNLIKQCLNNIKSFMLSEIKPPRYQSNYQSNADAVNSIKNDFELKYSWLDWIVTSFDTDKDTVYQTVNTDGEFWSFPAVHVGRRNIITYFLDKGSYRAQVKKDIEDSLSYILSNTLDDVVFETTCCGKNKSIVKNPTKVLFNGITSELNEREIWPYIKSLTLLHKEKNWQCAKDSRHNERLLEQTFTVEDDNNNRLRFRLLIIMKSEEERLFLKSDEEKQSLVKCSVPCLSGNKHCDQCKNNGECDHYPYSSAFFCACKPFYHGPRCEVRSNITIGENLEALFQHTLKIPKLDHIDFGINDMSSYIGNSLSNIQSAINHLGDSVGKAIAWQYHSLPTQFRWTGLLTAYENKIRSLQNFIEMVDDGKCYKGHRCARELHDLAEAILGPQRYYGIRKWLHDFNKLINGTSGFTLDPEDPLLIKYIERIKSHACTDEYKNAVDNVWRQVMLLQLRGYILWMQALHILNEPTDCIVKQYKDYTTSQIETMKKKACDISISDSLNVNCSGGFYLADSISLTTVCKPNHYLVGNRNITCSNAKPSCNSCNCSVDGSVSQACTDQTGICSCKGSNFGDKCENRDCTWSAWGAWSACICGYTNQTRSRRIIESQGGMGSCNGESLQTKQCFQSCCSNQFHCSRTRRCISESQHCDNRQDCTDNEDESDCCEIRYTPWNDNGGGEAIYLDRHHLDCGSSTKMITQFKLEASAWPKNEIRYVYTCCSFQTQFCTARLANNNPTEANRALIYLDKQNVDCGYNSIMGAFRLIISNGWTWYYQYKCCNIYSTYRHSCQDKYTAWSTEGSSKNFFLDRQNVQCDQHSYLSQFHLERDSGHTSIRYRYRCCSAY